MIRERITIISSVVAAFTGILGLILAIAIDTSPVRDWEIWDAIRIERGEGTTLVVAKLRNDSESRFSEELLEWIDEGGKQYEELGRTWKRQRNTREGQRKVKKLFEHTGALVLVEGYVGPEGTILHLWGRGASNAREVKFGRPEEDRKNAEHELDEVIVDALRQEAVEFALRMGEDTEYTRMKSRLKQIHQEVGDREIKRRVEFTTAYVENIRADKKGEEEKGQRAIRIYEDLLQYPVNDFEKAQILTNLGIAEFREARTKGNVLVATKALQRWSAAERLAANSGWIDMWISNRNFQSEGELWIELHNQDGKLAMQAWKRQIETFEDTFTVVDHLSGLTIQTWLERARKAALQNGGDNCVKAITGERTDEGRNDNGCEEITKWQMSKIDYERRLKRTERWINVARRNGNNGMEVSLIGIRANLLRIQGIKTKEPGLLISSFAGTHEFRTRLGIIDDGVGEAQLDLIIDPVLGLIELEAILALTCADKRYIETLVTEIGKAQLWCPKSSPIECNGRPSWKINLVKALEYAIGRKMEKTTEEETNVYWRVGTEGIWSLAEHAKKWIESGQVNKSLCPNRPQGIKERKVVRIETTVNKRTSKFQRVERTVTCKLPDKEWSIAPSVPVEYDELARWREDVQIWIDQFYRQIDLDIQAIRECEGEPE